MEELLCSAGDRADEALVAQAQEGDLESLTQLVKRYMPFVRRRVAAFNPQEADRDDLIQEGLLGFLAAVKAYDPRRGASFKTFCFSCVQNKILAELEMRASQKQRPLRDWLPLEDLPEAASDPNSDPFSIVEAQEGRESLLEQASARLSPLEWNTLTLFLDGLSYQEIGRRLELSSKAVDNALQRVRRKLQDVR